MDKKVLRKYTKKRRRHLWLYVLVGVFCAAVLVWLYITGMRAYYDLIDLPVIMRAF